MGVAEYLEVMNFLQRNEPIDNEVHVIIDEPVVVVDDDDFHVINEVLVLEDHHFSPDDNANDGLVIVEDDHDPGADEYDQPAVISDEERPLVIDDRGEPSDSADSSVSSGTGEEPDPHDDRCHSTVSETIELCIKTVGGAGPSGGGGGCRSVEEEEDDALPGRSRDLSEEEELDWWDDSDESDIEFYFRNYFSDCNDDETMEYTPVKKPVLDSVDPDDEDVGGGEEVEEEEDEDEERLSVVTLKRSSPCERAEDDRKRKKTNRCSQFWDRPDSSVLVDTTEDAGGGQKTGEDVNPRLEEEAKHLKPSGKRSGKRKHIEANEGALRKKSRQDRT